MTRFDLRDERGVALVLFAVVLPLLLLLTTISWDAGNWWVHRKHLQTKVDAAALAAAGVWSFPCASDSDTNGTETGIIDVARKYVGQHVQADGTSYTGTTFNPQVGPTPGTRIHVVLNGSNWYDDDQGLNPADKSGQSDPTTSICNSEFLDVKGTEGNSHPLFGWIPIAPDLKRKARVEIHQVEGLSGLLPIAVRLPTPESAAAIFYNETPGANYGNILAVRYFCPSNSVPGLPAGLGGWSTYPTGNLTGTPCDWGSNYTFTWGQATVTEAVGVAIAISIRKACPDPASGTSCFAISGYTNVDALCNQGAGLIVQCYFNGDPAGNSTLSGLQFIHGYDGSANAGSGPPVVKGVWLDTPSANCGAYFSAPGGNSCSAVLHANVDAGSCIRAPGSSCWDDPGPPTGETRTSTNTEVRWKISYGTGNNDDICGTWSATQCDLNPSWTASLTVPPGNPRYSIALRVRLRNTKVAGFPACQDDKYSSNCEWYFTSNGRSGMGVEPNNATIFANPLQRTFIGNINRTGPVKWLRLTADASPPCDFPAFADDSASMPFGNRCFYVDMGLQGALSRDQDEPPIALNLGVTDPSHRALLDCDPTIPNLKEQVVQGCGQPKYARNNFDTAPICPDSNQFFSGPKPAPFDTDYPPWRCALTQPTQAANQLEQGMNLRLFGVSNNPNCPTEDTNWPTTTPPTPAPFTPGRNYWHNANNVIDEYTFADDKNTATTTDDLKNRVRDDDPRLVTLFFTPYNSFAGSGGRAVYPVVGFGSFYITGYGRIDGGNLVNEDPCTDGNPPPAQVGAGNLPPPDLDTSQNTTYIWGHFVKDVVIDVDATPSEELCAQNELDPCVAVLVE